MRDLRTSLHLSLYLNNYAIVLRLSPRKNPTPHRIQPRFSSTLREYPTERRFEVQLGRRAFFRCSLARDQRQTTAAFIDWCCWLAAPAPDSTATTRRLLLLERLAAESDLVVVSGCFFWFRKVGISIGRQGRLRRCDAWLLVHGFLAELELRMMQSASAVQCWRKMCLWLWGLRSCGCTGCTVFGSYFCTSFFTFDAIPDRGVGPCQNN